MSSSVHRRRLAARSERWPLSRPFRIARGVKTAAEVVVVEAHDGDCVGFGECVPYARYGESLDSVLAQIGSVADAFAAGMTRADLQLALPAGAARNAVDCALWDLEAKRAGRSVAELAGLPDIREMVTAVTVSLDAPARMAEAAAALAGAPLIKVKVDSSAPLDAVAAVRTAAPDARLIVDPNESWSPELLFALLPRLAELGVDLIEQPIPANLDGALEGLSPPIPICADEAAHTTADLARVARCYRSVNIKLDKTGGLTEALELADLAQSKGIDLMVGNMVGTSLAMAPGYVIAQLCRYVDLDGALVLKQDRDNAMTYEGGVVSAPSTSLWG